jgi:hypothetical protein
VCTLKTPPSVAEEMWELAGEDFCPPPR